MSARAFNRWQAAGTHFVICVAVALLVVVLMLAVWYPRPLFEAAGGNDLLVILVAVDVVIGPLCTLVIFKAGKWGLKFDLTVIALLQVAALAYGVHIVFLARPAFIVFVKDRFELATAVELAPEELAAAKRPEFRAVPLTGPKLVAGDFPADPAERSRLAQAALAGMDLQHFPRYYVPYTERRKEVLAKADTVARLRKAEPGIAKVVDEHLKDSGTKEDAVRVLLLRTRFAWIAVLIDPATAEPVKMLLAEKIAP
jgi:hypothetical protein